MKKVFILLIIIVVAGIAGGVYFYLFSNQKEGENLPEEKICDDLCGDGVCQQIVCLGTGCPCAETKETCSVDCAKSDLIRVYSPLPNQEIESPLIIKGEARGYWFFEADFPVILTNWDGLIIAQTIAWAKGEWMTEDFVQFEAQLEFEKPEYSNKGTLILQKDNPSGLPENDDALEIPVIFK